MKAHGVEPIVTLFHFDLPQYIQDLGGPTNPFFVEYFIAYAETMFERFGDKVSHIYYGFNLCIEKLI